MDENTKFVTIVVEYDGPIHETTPEALESALFGGEGVVSVIALAGYHLVDPAPAGKLTD